MGRYTPHSPEARLQCLPLVLPLLMHSPRFQPKNPHIGHWLLLRNSELRANVVLFLGSCFVVQGDFKSFLGHLYMNKDRAVSAQKST